MLTENNHNLMELCFHNGEQHMKEKIIATLRSIAGSMTCITLAQAIKMVEDFVMPKPWENKSGCADPTAYAATRPTPEEIEVSKLVKAIKAVADLFGYEIINRIEFRNKTTGRNYR